MKYLIASWTTVLLSGLLVSCVDEIPLPDYGAEQRKLVVEGRAIKGKPSRVFVQLSRTTDLSIQGVPIFIEDAEVRLYSQGGESTALIHQGRGYYSTELTAGSPFDLQTGQSYRVQIELPNGSRYQSSWEPLHPVPEPDSVRFSEVDKPVLNDAGNIVTQPHVEYQLTTPLIPNGYTSPVALLWEAEGVFRLYESPTLLNPRICYITEQVAGGRVKVFSDLSNASTGLVRYPVLEKEIDWRFTTGYFLSLYQYSLSKGAAQYWQQVDQVIQRDGGLFETPPGGIPSNISNLDDQDEQVLGYFFAGAVDTIRLLIMPDELSRPLTLYCDTQFGEGGDVCFDCLQWPHSTLQRPAYW